MLCNSPNCYSAQRYGVARLPTPVLNTPDISSVFGEADGSTLKTDRCGMVRNLEFIAIPATVFSIISELRFDITTVYQVETTEYTAPTGIKLYIDSRFIKIHETEPVPRKKILPPKQQILSTLRDSIGNHYVWGGNVSSGVPALRELFYKDAISKDSTINSFRTLAGVDCSGLLYQATDGWTPRNTSQLVKYGTGVKITGRSADEILKLLKPLDLIVWNGHVVIVLSQDIAIESRLDCEKISKSGVVTTPLKQRLDEILRFRKPVDRWKEKGISGASFVIRRWYVEDLTE